MKHNELEGAFQQAAEKTEEIKAQVQKLETEVQDAVNAADSADLGEVSIEYAKQIAESGLFAQYVEEFGIVGAVVAVVAGLGWTWMKKKKETDNEIKEMDGRKEEEEASKEKEVTTGSVQKTESQPPKTK
jgi:hypothetical protein